MSSDSTLLEEEPSVIVTSREDKFCRVAEETVAQQVVEDKNDNSSRNMVNASPKKTMVRNTEAGESQVGAVIATTPVTNKTPKGSPSHVATTSPNLVNVNSIRQSPLHQASNISPPRSYNKLQYSSPAHTPEANQNHSNPKRSNDEVRSRSHPPSVRQTNITRSPCRIPQNRNGQTQIPRTPSPIMPPSRCLKPRSQEIAYPNKLLAENRNRINTNDTQMNNFVQEVLADVTEYKLQLQQLIEVLTDVEKDCGEKDEIIRQQQKEIEFWRNKAVALESNISGNVNLSSPSRRPMRSANQNESVGVAMGAGKTNSEESTMR